MLSINKKRSYTGIIWHDYIKSVQNLEKCVFNFFCWVRNFGRLNNHIQYSKNKIEIEWVWFCKVSKHIGRLIVKLKAIKYKKNSFRYLFS